MGTKNNPGKYDCYSKAYPDEPMFVLLARDRFAPALVRLWALLRSYGSTEQERDQLAEAQECVDAMKQWRKKNGRETMELRPLETIPFAMLKQELERRGAKVLPPSVLTPQPLGEKREGGSYEAAPIRVDPQDC